MADTLPTEAQVRELCKLLPYWRSEFDRYGCLVDATYANEVEADLLAALREARKPKPVTLWVGNSCGYTVAVDHQPASMTGWVRGTWTPDPEDTP